jgi:protein TonB
LIAREAIYTEEARQKKINGSCMIAVVVDSQGMPRNIEIVKSLNPGLDENAAYAVSQYRFKPAIKDGEPIPTKVYVEVNFRLY